MIFVILHHLPPHYLLITSPHPPSPSLLQAIELKEDFRSALFNLALLLTDDQRPLEAAPFLNQLVKHHPDHVKGLILLGDIYINNIKDLDAAEKVGY